MSARHRLIGAAACLLAAWPLPSPAQPANTVRAEGAWARATTPGVVTGGVYLTLTSPAGDKLVGASSPAAARAGVHEMRMDGAVMRMRPVEGGLDLPPGRAVTLAPSGFHIMLEGLRAPLRQGATVPVRLTFEKAPPLDVEARVEAIGSAGPGAGAPGMSMAK